MENDNKQFLDKIGVQYLWDKINQYFSQIGHRHDTSNVNGLDEYMEENARIVKELYELPLYPTEEQVGKIYAYGTKVYRAKKLDKLVLDFSTIDGDIEGKVTQEMIRDFINKNGMNVVMNYGEDDNEFESDIYNKYHNGLLIDGPFYFRFENRRNYEMFDWWNSIFVKSIKITAQSPYDDDNEETYQGVVEYYFDDFRDANTVVDNWQLSSEYKPQIESKTFSFGKNKSADFVDYIRISGAGQAFTLLKLELEVVTYYNEDEYMDGTYHDFLVWEEVGNLGGSIKVIDLTGDE